MQQQNFPLCDSCRHSPGSRVLVPGPGAAVSANFWDASEKNI